MARFKNKIAYEEKYKQFVAQSQINISNIDEVIQINLKESGKQYDSASSSLHKVVVILNDLHAGILNLGQICHPNYPANV